MSKLDNPEVAAPYAGQGLLAGLTLAGLTVAVYANSLNAPFVFDDLTGVLGNPSRLKLWPIGEALLPPTASGAGTIARPLANLSLAVNYQLSGDTVWGYHAFNLAVHVLAGLALFGLLRRTLLLPVLRERFGAMACPLAWVAALVWLVHPLATETVTGVIQRAEAMAGLFYFLTLYCFMRAVTSGQPGRWQVLTVGSCLLGMASKEVMATAPLVVWLFDGTFVAPGLREAWQQRRRLYLGLMATWVPLAGLMATSGQRAGTVGFDLGVSWQAYLLRQCEAVVLYLGLAVWPHPLVLDYGTEVVTSVTQVIPQLAFLVLLGIGTAYGLRRRWAVGFLGAWFFIILAPSSSVVPLITQTMAEHRMYLPLAAVVVLGVVGAYRLAGGASLVIFMLMAIALGWLTVLRNADYHNEVTIWADTVAKRPENARALSFLAVELSRKARLEEAVGFYQKAREANPQDATMAFSLGNLLQAMNRLPEAIEQFQAALAMLPDMAEARYNLGVAWWQMGETQKGLEEMRRTVVEKPDYAEAQVALANMLVSAGRGDEAIWHLQAALQAKPAMVKAHYDWGLILLAQGQWGEAVREYREVVRLEPDYADAHTNLGVALMAEGREADAMQEFVRALKLRPDSTQARANLELSRERATQAGRP